MADEAQELREQAEKAREDRSLAAVSLTMAVLAVLVAVVSLLGHRAHTEEVVLQAKSSDQWAFYQAKNIRQHEDELFVATNNSGAAADVREKYSQEADRYDLAEVFLEIGLVITSITLLSGRRIFWHLGIVLSVVGLVVAVMGALVH